MSVAKGDSSCTYLLKYLNTKIFKGIILLVFLHGYDRSLSLRAKK
jgi:hypothetical protein